MQAILCSSYGPAENLSIEKVPNPKPEADEAIVEVFSASLNFPDGLQIQGKYQFQPPMPFSPGSEVGGRIIEVGSSVSEFEIGDRVMATPGIGGLAERVKVKQPHFKKVSKEKLREIKKQIRTRAKSEYKKEVIIYMISVALALVMLALLLIWLN